MFRALLCPSSGSRNYNVDLPHWSFRSVMMEGVASLHYRYRLHFTERNDQCGNQHYSRELRMMGI
jgi:hypothetical protein